MQRTISGFHRDDDGDWVAELSCLHSQHVRHRPPFQQRPWVLDEAGRAERVGAMVDCLRCDRAEMPDGLTLIRRLGPFTAGTVPDGLHSRHRLAEGTWGALRVLDGAVRFSMAGDAAFDVTIEAGGSQAIPPGVPHAVTVDGPVRLVVELFAWEHPRRAAPDSEPPS